MPQPRQKRALCGAFSRPPNEPCGWLAAPATEVRAAAQYLSARWLGILQIGAPKSRTMPHALSSTSLTPTSKLLNVRNVRCLRTLNLRRLQNSGALRTLKPVFAHTRGSLKCLKRRVLRMLSARPALTVLGALFLLVRPAAAMALSLGADIPPPEFSFFEFIVFGVLTPLAFMFYLHLVNDVLDADVQAAKAKAAAKALAEKKAEAKALSAVISASLASSPEANADTFEPSSHAGLNTGADIHVPLPSSEEALELLYGSLSKAHAFLLDIFELNKTLLTF